jgi:hypothetical protein
MRVGVVLNKIVGVTFLFFLFSCQKDDTNEKIKVADICPEVAMQNFDEARLIINEYLNNHSGISATSNFEELDKYFQQCDCVDSIGTSEEIIDTYPEIKEYNIRFVINSDTLNSVLDFAVFDDGRIELRRFHE